MQAHEGLRRILRRARPPPLILITDEDPGFKAPEFQRALEERRIVHQFRAGRNDLATVDRLIATVKRIISSQEAENDPTTLAEVIDGINESGTRTLYGSALEDVRGNKPLIFQRQWDESKGMEDNTKSIHIRARKLQEAGAYRTLEMRGFRPRAGQAIWSRGVEPIGQIEGAFVDGRPTKEVLAVPRGSTELAPPAARPDHHAQRVLGPLATFLQEQLAEGPLSYPRAKQLLEEHAGSPQALQAMYREARTTLRGIVPTLARVFPEDFELRGQSIALR